MVRSWGYCKETSEKINLLFLPTGEVFNSLEEGEYGGFFSTPLRDAEYKPVSYTHLTLPTTSRV